MGVELKLARYAASGWGDIDALKALFVIFAQRRIAPCPDEGEAFLQLATLGTIADLMPLRDENRIIVKRGIQAMGNSPCKGIADLLQVQGLGRSLSSTEIAWQVTPLLNAAGRLGRPEIALDLLLSSDPSAREKAVQDIVKANAERKKMGADTWEAVYPLARESYEANEHRFVIVRSTAVRAGYRMPHDSAFGSYRRALGDGTIVGSIRAANNFRVSGLLAACAELFIDYGGHDAAAGFSLTADRWERFEAIAVEHLKSAELADDQESIAVDAELPHAYLRPELRSIYAIFEPFGEENRPLVFMARGVPMVDAQIVGKAAKNHLKLTLDFGKYKWPALLWDGAERLERDFSFRPRTG